MGEAKRKRAVTAMLHQIVETYWDALAVPKRQGMPMDRAEMLALLFEKATLGRGLSEAESDKFFELMNEIDRRATAAGVLPPDDEDGSDNWREIGEVLPEAAKIAIDAERMRAIEERGQVIAQFVGNAARDLGWVVMLFELGNRPELTYLTNCAREDVVKMLDEFKQVLQRRGDFPPGVLGRPN